MPINDEDEFDRQFELIGQFAADFARLVRKYMPRYPRTDAEALTLVQMQDKTSCYNPYVWSSEFDPPTEG